MPGAPHSPHTTPTNTSRHCHTSPQSKIATVENHLCRETVTLDFFLSFSFAYRHNSHTIKFTISKCTIQWFLIHSQSHATITIPEYFHHVKKVTPYATAVTPSFPLSISPWKPLIYFGSGHMPPPAIPCRVIRYVAFVCRASFTWHGVTWHGVFKVHPCRSLC